MAFARSAQLSIFAFLALALLAPGAATAAPGAAPDALPGAVWGVELDRAGAGVLRDGGGSRLARAGVNAVFLRRLGPTAERQARRRVRAARLTDFGPLPAAASVAGTTERCRRLELGSPGARCAALAASPADALALAGGGLADIVAVRLDRPDQLRRLTGAPGRIVAIVPLRAPVRRADWASAVRRAHLNPGLDLVAAPEGRAGSRALARFLPRLRGVRPVDRISPPAPSGFSARSALTSIGLAWGRPDPDSGVVSHGLYRDGEYVGTLTGSATRLDGLLCGRRHLFEVDAVDAAGNRSAKVPLSAATAACLLPVLPAGPALDNALSGLGTSDALPSPLDVTPPAAPAGLAAGDRTLTSLSVAWQAVTDAAGYRVFVNGADTGTVTAPLKALGTLTCGTAYTIGVEAFDAAGNTSPRTVLNASTLVCPDTQAPAAPAGLAVAERTGSSLTLSWQPSSDDVAVTGYRSFRDGGSSATTPTTTRTFAGLECGTRYTLAVEAFDAAGNTSSRALLVASTSDCPDTQAPSKPTGLKVSDATQNSLELSWDPSTDDVGVTGYRSFKDGGSPETTTTTTSRTFIGLTCGTTYTLAVEAFDAAGNTSSPPSELQATTSACPDTQAPSKPAGLAITERSTTSLTLSWDPSSDNLAVAGYRSFKDGGSSETTTTTSRSFSGLTCGTTYTLAVEAFDAAGNTSSPPSELQATTSACPDTQAPSKPAGLAITERSTTSLTLSWDPSSDNLAVAGYRSFKDGGSSESTTTTSRSFNGLTCGTTYTLAVEAFDAANNTSPKNELEAATSDCPDTQAPSKPAGLAITDRSTTSVTLSWDPSSDNLAVAGYRSFKDGGSSETTTTTSRTFSGLTCGTTYTLAVEAFDPAGNTSSPPSELQATTSACPDTQAPSKPTGLAITERSTTSLTLSWDPSSDNLAVAGYRSFKDGGSSETTTTTSRTFTGLTCGTTCTLAVEAFDAAGNASPKTELEATTSACPDTQAPSKPAGLAITERSTTSLTLSWDPSSDNLAVAGYRSFKDGGSSESTTTTSRTFSGLTCGTTYTLAVEAFDAANNTSPKTEVEAATSACPDTQAPSKPTGLAISARSGDSFTLSWDPSNDNVAVTGYRSFKNGGSSETTTTTSRTFTGLTCGTTYTLAVEAFDAANNTSPKTELEAATSACPDTQAPSKPAGLAITERSTTSLTLSWDPSSDNLAVAGYRSFKDGGSSESTTTTSRSFNGLTCGTTYTLAVEAFDAANNTSPNTELEAATSACPDTQAPSKPAGLAITERSTTSLTLSWDPSSDDRAVTGYRSFKNGGSSETTTTTSRTFTGLTCGTTYTLAVEAFDAAGNTSSPPTELQATTATCPDESAPTAPTGLTISARTTTSFTLSWQASSDDLAVAGYRSFRNGGSSETTTTRSRNFTGLTCGTTYTLAVEAFDVALNTSPRTELRATTSDCPDTTPPTAPSGLAVSDETTTSVKLTWSASTDDVAVTGYRSYRNGAAQATTTSTSRTFTGLQCDTAYDLAVEAVDAAGNESTRPEIQGRTAACPPVDPAVSVYLSPTGSDAAACTQAAPCKTFDRGYRAADPGEKVQVADGLYPGQQVIPVDAGKLSGGDVTFEPAPGADVRLESLDVFGRNVEIRGISIERDFYVKCDADGVTLRDSKAALFFIRSASDVTIADTEFGPSSDISQIGIIQGDPECESAPRSVVMDGVYMHDYVNPDTHMECLTLQAFDDMVIRNSKFTRCQDFDLFLKARAPALANRDLLIENNWFDVPAPTGTSAIQTSEPEIGGSYTNLTIRNNSFAGALTLKPDVTYANLRVLSNVGTRWSGSCAQAESAYNVWATGDVCSGTDRQAPSGFVDQSGFDFHLAPGAAAIDGGHPTDFPSTDIDGDARPRGAAPDAGADERE